MRAKWGRDEGFGMKIGQWDRDMLFFVGRIGGYDKYRLDHNLQYVTQRKSHTVFICIINGFN